MEMGFVRLTVLFQYTNSGDAVCESHKKKYDLCSNCGTLYGRGTLNGALCDNCEERD